MWLPGVLVLSMTAGSLVFKIFIAALIVHNRFTALEKLLSIILMAICTAKYMVC